MEEDAVVEKACVVKAVSAVKNAVDKKRRKDKWPADKRKKRRQPLIVDGRKVLCTTAAPRKSPASMRPEAKPKKQRVITRAKRCDEPSAMDDRERKLFDFKVQTTWKNVNERLVEDRNAAHTRKPLTLKAMTDRKLMTKRKFMTQDDCDKFHTAYALWGEYWLPGRVYFILSPDTDTDPKSSVALDYYHGEHSDIVAFAFVTLDAGVQQQCAIHLCDLRFL